MSIKLSLEKGAIKMTAILADEAFPELLAIIQNRESKDAVQAAPARKLPGDIVLFGEPGGDTLENVKEFLRDQSAPESLNYFKWDTNPEKILVLAAHFEAKGGAEGWRSADMETKFAEAKEAFPGNFSRDIVSAVKSGWIATVTPRTYTVSRTGWKRIGDEIAKFASAQSQT